MCLRTLFSFTETYVSSLYFIIFLKLLYVKGRKKEDSPDSLSLYSYCITVESSVMLSLTLFLSC